MSLSSRLKDSNERRVNMGSFYVDRATADELDKSLRDLGVKNRAEAIRVFIEWGLEQLETEKGEP